MNNIDGLIKLLDLKTHIEVYCRLSDHFLLQHKSEKSMAYFHLLLKGSCTMRAMNGQIFQVSAGDFCLWPHGSAHFIGEAQCVSENIQHYQKNGLNIREQADTDAFQMLCGSFTAQNSAAASILHFLPEPMIVSLQDVPQLNSLAKLIHAEAQMPQAGSVTIIESLCNVLLLLALRKASQQTSHVSAMVPLFADFGLARAANAILVDPFLAHTIDSLAQTALMSRATFVRKFQTATGMGVQQFIRLLKMSTAAQLLRKNQAVQKVAEAVGYQSEAAFVQAFRAQFGCTPSAYRKQEIRPLKNQPNIFIKP